MAAAAGPAAVGQAPPSIFDDDCIKSILAEAQTKPLLPSRRGLNQLSDAGAKIGHLHKSAASKATRMFATAVQAIQQPTSACADENGALPAPATKAEKRRQMANISPSVALLNTGATAPAKPLSKSERRKALIAEF